MVVVHDMAPMALDHFADCNTIITVQKIHKMFPSVRMITELSHSSNMRFVQFNPNDHYSLEQSKIEKVLQLHGKGTRIDLERTEEGIPHAVYVPTAFRCRRSVQCQHAR